MLRQSTCIHRVLYGELVFMHPPFLQRNTSIHLELPVCPAADCCSNHSLFTHSHLSSVLVCINCTSSSRTVSVSLCCLVPVASNGVFRAFSLRQLPVMRAVTVEATQYSCRPRRLRAGSCSQLELHSLTDVKAPVHVIYQSQSPNLAVYLNCISFTA